MENIFVVARGLGMLRWEERDGCDLEGIARGGLCADGIVLYCDCVFSNKIYACHKMTQN